MPTGVTNRPSASATNDVQTVRAGVLIGHVPSQLQRSGRRDMRANCLQVAALHFDELRRRERVHLPVTDAAPPDDVHHHRAPAAVRRSFISSISSPGLGTAVVRKDPQKLNTILRRLRCPITGHGR